jgi:hypothetical protein
MENCSKSKCEKCFIFIRKNLWKHSLCDALWADTETIIMWFRLAGFGGINVYVTVQIGIKFIKKIIVLAIKPHRLKKKKHI